MKVFSFNDFPTNDLTNNFINIKKEVSDFSCKTHRHNFIEIVYIYRGDGFHYVDGIEYHLKKGDLIIIPPKSTHSLYSSNKMSYYNLGIDTTLYNSESSSHSFDFYKALHTIFLEINSLTDLSSICFSFKNKQLLQIEQLFENMLYEYNEKHTTYELIILSQLSILYMYILRAKAKNTTTKQYAINDILEYISLNYPQKLSLDEIAKKFYYNKSYLSRLIKERTGNTFSDYIQKIRITKACEILNDDNYISITEIASMIGYKSNNLFYEHFKKHIGISPQKYKEKYKQKYPNSKKEPHETLF